MPSVLPEEAQQLELGEYADDVHRMLLHDDDSMNAAAEYFDRFVESGRVGQDHERLFATQVFDIFEGNRFAGSSLLCKLTERRNLVLFRLGKSDYQQQIRVEIAVVKGANRGFGSW